MTATIESISTDCVECHLHFEPTPEEAAEHARTHPDTGVTLTEWTLRRSLYDAGWLRSRGTGLGGDIVKPSPTCPECVGRLTTERLATMSHPGWGCADCEFDLDENVAVHRRTWRVSDVPAVKLTVHVYDHPDVPDEHDLRMVEVWEDFSADEAAHFALMFGDICKVLDENGLRHIINAEVNARLDARRAHLGLSE